MKNSPMVPVLILEDDPIFLETLLDLLEDDYDVRGASDADSAIELAKEKGFELFITDIRMGPQEGGRDGIMAATAVKRLLPSIIVIVVTGFANEEAPLRALQAGVDHYIYKSELTLARLQAGVAHVLANREKTRKGFFSQLFEPLFEKPLKFLEAQEQKRLAEVRKAVDEAKFSCYRQFVVAVGSKKLLSSKAIELWDELAEIEVSSKSAKSMGDVKALLAAYQRAEPKIGESLGKLGSQTTRGEGRVDIRSFRVMCEKIGQSKITADDLLFAELVRRTTPQERQRHPQWEAIYQQVWCEN
jgi:DNA-binding NarL/FixJ family response regulator